MWWVTTSIVGFAVSALLLAAVGLFGVVAYNTSLRSHEFSVRLALGARPRVLMLGVLGESLAVTLAGACAGLVLAVPAGLVIRQGTSLAVWSPAVPAVVLAVMTITALAAATLPAARTARTDAIRALRTE